MTKTTNQANYFGLTNFGVLTQIPGSSVVVVTGQGGCPMKELRRRQTSCCQADSERGSQGICKPGQDMQIPAWSYWFRATRLVSPRAYGMEALGNGTAGCLRVTPLQSAHLHGTSISLAESYPESPCFSPVASRRCYIADLCRTERITLSEEMGQGAQKGNK